MEFFREGLDLLLHPVAAYEELKFKRKWNLAASMLVLVVWFFTTIFQRQLTEFNFNHHRVEGLNVFYIMLSTFVVFIAWTASNWAFCTLLEGKGTLKEIWVSSAFALIPYVVFTMVITFLSHLLTLEEGVFLTWLDYIGKGWSIFLMLSGLKVIHEYSLKKTILSVALTILGMAILTFLAILVFGLLQQVSSFFVTLYYEFVLRM